jgi:cellulose synthase/poly-beta-1,6-N-acetylglucosamine synthase-like glycosyltransferase
MRGANMKIEVLVATMKQNDLSKYHDMNLSTDAVFANQDDRYEYIEETILGNRVQMITTSERGVGKNRNNALMHSSGTICLFADDDMIYEKDYEKIVLEAFTKLPDAGIIIFNIEIAGNEARTTRLNKTIKKSHIYNSLNYGAPRMAVRRDELLKKNIWFSILYGGGAPYSAGEDSLFVVEAIKKGMKVYTYPKKIAYIKQESSTWFEGYTEKYYMDKGVWLANAFPVMKYPLALYYAYKLKDSSNKTMFQIYKLILLGIRNFSEVRCQNE